MMASAAENPEPTIKTGCGSEGGNGAEEVLGVEVDLGAGLERGMADGQEKKGGMENRDRIYRGSGVSIIA